MARKGHEEVPPEDLDPVGRGLEGGGTGGNRLLYYRSYYPGILLVLPCQLTDPTPRPSVSYLPYGATTSLPAGNSSVKHLTLYGNELPERE